MWPAGTARSPVRGDVGLEVICRRIPGRRTEQCSARAVAERVASGGIPAACGRLGCVLQRPPAGSIPDAPGSYQFKDRDGRVIYVGKAKSLRSRLSNYFQNPAHLPPRTAQMVAVGRDASSGSRSATTSRPSCSSTASSSSTSPGSTSGCGTTRAIRSWPSP